MILNTVHIQSVSADNNHYEIILLWNISDTNRVFYLKFIISLTGTFWTDMLHHVLRIYR